MKTHSPSQKSPALPVYTLRQKQTANYKLPNGFSCHFFILPLHGIIIDKENL
jgi:hypothetical protein